MGNKLLIFTNVFPDESTPNTGFYVKEQVMQLKAFFDIKVIKAKPSKSFGWNGTSFEKTIYDGIEIYTFQYTVLPKVGVFFSGRSYLNAVRPLVKTIHKEFDFDVIVAYWTYPEGHAAGKVAKEYGVPFLLRPRGSDINLFLDNPVLKSLIRVPLKLADRVVPVTEDMARKVKKLGVLHERVDFIHNGLNSREFYPLEKDNCRKEIGISMSEKVILFVGNFLEVKGIAPFLEAIRLLDRPDNGGMVFYFLGKGPLGSAIENAREVLRYIKIKIIGDIAHGQLVKWLNAADLLCLPSKNEGCPNVVLEALACGLPVAASNVGGIPELINSPELGILFRPSDAGDMARSIEDALQRSWDKKRLMLRVAQQSWDKVGERLKMAINGLSV
ncbi:MAG: glycosyltransferase [Candidatus Omnitrophica bacterium]|nr:glycosyltransferase [Candidatus Omnitrophota bacterium]MDE2222741.1 glycosyltransferase [Candidatus Omnitrophota bacterium]